jgi:hypothetical protein
MYYREPAPLEAESLSNPSHFGFTTSTQGVDRARVETVICREKPAHRLFVRIPAIGEHNEGSTKFAQRFAVDNERLGNLGHSVDLDGEKCAILDESADTANGDAERSGYVGEAEPAFFG